MSSRFNFAKFLTDTIAVWRIVSAIGSNGGMENTPTVRHASILCSLQPVAGDKMEWFAQQNIIATHVAITNTIYALSVGDYFIDAHGVSYDVVFFEAQGGENNPVGVVFAIYGKVQLNR